MPDLISSLLKYVIHIQTSAIEQVTGYYRYINTLLLLAMTSLSVTIVLFMLNVNFLLELLASFPIIIHSIFPDLDKSFL